MISELVLMTESGVRSSCAILPMNCFCAASAPRAGERVMVEMMRNDGGENDRQNKDYEYDEFDTIKAQRLYAIDGLIDGLNGGRRNLRALRMDGLMDADADRRADALVDLERRKSDDRHDDHGKTKLKRNDVDLSAEKRIVAVSIQRAGNRCREPFPGRRYCSRHQVFFEDF
jgi:hypothetical protein